SGSRFAFRNGPYTVVFSREERTAGVHQQHFYPMIPAPEHEQTGADAASRLLRASRHNSFYASRGCRDRRDVSFAAPEMKCVGENDVAHQIVIGTITDVQRGIELEIGCDVAGEPDRRRVFRAALPIDL